MDLLISILSSNHIFNKFFYTRLSCTEIKYVVRNDIILNRYSIIYNNYAVIYNKESKICITK